MESVSLQREPPNFKSVRQKIEEFLIGQLNTLTPVEIAQKTGLNRHTVRRELPAMLKDDLVIKDEKHAYALKRQPRCAERFVEVFGRAEALGKDDERGGIMSSDRVIMLVANAENAMHGRVKGWADESVVDNYDEMKTQILNELIRRSFYVKFGSTLISPKKLRDALKVIGHRNVKVLFNPKKSQPIIVENAQKERIVIAPIQLEDSVPPTALTYKEASAKNWKTGKKELRALVGQLVDEYAKINQYYCFEFGSAEPSAESGKRRVEKLLRDIEKGRLYGGIAEVKGLAERLWGRKEHEGFVTYGAEPPEWFKKLAALLSLDNGLKGKSQTEFQSIVNEDRRRRIVDQLKSDPYLLGDIRDFHQKRGEELLQELRDISMPAEELEKLEAEVRPTAMRIVYNYWLKEMDWYRRLLTRDIMRLARQSDRSKEQIEYARNWIEHAKQAYEDLKKQGKAIGEKPPEIPWIEKYERRLEAIQGIARLEVSSTTPPQIQVLELKEPLENAPVTVRVRRPIEGKTWRRNQHMETTWGEAKPLVEQALVTMISSRTPAPQLDTFLGNPKLKDSGWHVVGRWTTLQDAQMFLSDGYHEDFPDSDYWDWKKRNYEFAVLHWQNGYWPAVGQPQIDAGEAK